MLDYNNYYIEKLKNLKDIFIASYVIIDWLSIQTIHTTKLSIIQVKEIIIKITLIA